ncbi:unnamed protein product, partial [Ectocarpus sp. 12 AP-2014]
GDRWSGKSTCHAPPSRLSPLEDELGEEPCAFRSTDTRRSFAATVSPRATVGAAAPPCAVGGHNHDRARNAGPCLNVARMRASLTGSLTLVSLLAVVTGTGLSVTWIELLTSDPIESTACFPPSSSAPSLAPACKRRMNTSRE